MEQQEQGFAELAAAMFSYEFLDGGVRYETIERIHQGEVEEWVAALAATGLLDARDLGRIGTVWRRNPRQLLDALLTAADEITRHRCTTAWAALDRMAPLVQYG